jgi:hypothetical protein
MCAEAKAPVDTNVMALAAIDSNIVSALTAVDAIANQRIQTLGLVLLARRARLTRAAAAVERYGTQSYQAIAARTAVDASTLAVARVAVVSRQAATSPPQVAESGWALYGHVYNSQLQPVSAYTVFLVDSKNTFQQQYGLTYTKGDGSFEIIFQGPSNASDTAPQLFVEIANAKAQLIYLSPTAFQPQTGLATYQNITLPEGEPVIGDPPAGVKEVAMPEIKPQPTQTRSKKSSSPPQDA